MAKGEDPYKDMDSAEKDRAKKIDVDKELQNLK